MNKDAWEAMEAKAREIMAKKWAAEKADADKFRLIHEYNLEHPILKKEEVQANQQEVPPVIITSADYVLSYLFPQDTARKKNKRKK